MNESNNNFEGQKTLSLSVKALLMAGELLIAAGTGYGGSALQSRVEFNTQNDRISAMEVQLGKNSRTFENIKDSFESIQKSFARNEKARDLLATRVWQNSLNDEAAKKAIEAEFDRLDDLQERMRYLERRKPNQ